VAPPRGAPSRETKTLKIQTTASDPPLQRPLKPSLFTTPRDSFRALDAPFTSPVYFFPFGNLFVVDDVLLFDEDF
jgi:hypothetical protein